MTSRERVLASLEHREADRLPIDIGGIVNLTSMHRDAYAGLLKYLGLDDRKPVIGSVMHQSVFIDEDIRERFHSDTYPLFYDNSTLQITTLPDGAQQYTDAFGILWRKPKNGLYFDMAASPFAGDTLDLDNWEIPAVPVKKMEALKPRAKEAHDKGLFTIFSPPYLGGVLSLSQRLIGYQDILMMMLTDPERFEEIISRLADYELRMYQALIDTLGDTLDAVVFGDDLVTQTGFFFRPEIYREMIKPYHKKIVDSIHARGNYKVIYHCCGAIAPLLEDFIDCGYDAVNPIQLSATGMGDTAALKQKYGDRISFWGGSCDTQKGLPVYTPEQVREEVRRRVNDFSGNGGFVLCSVHNLQRDVSPENIVTLYESFYENAFCYTKK